MIRELSYSMCLLEKGDFPKYSKTDILWLSLGKILMKKGFGFYFNDPTMEMLLVIPNIRKKYHLLN